MQNDILKKIMKTIEGRFDREADVLYLLAEIWKYLESSREAGYSKLRLFCNWAVHSELSGHAAQQIVSFVDSYLQKSFANKCTEADIMTFEKILNLDDFRAQLRAFLQGHVLPDTLCEDDNWTEFLSLYARVVEDCPLTLTGNANAHALIDQLTVSFVEDDTAVAVQLKSFYPMDWEFFKSGIKRGTLKLRPRGELVGSALEWK